VVDVITENDDMMIWRENAHMIINGEVMDGEMMITTRSVYFSQTDRKGFLMKERPERIIWDLPISGIKDIHVHEVEGHAAPFIRIRYSENDAFFTFPGRDLEQTQAALIIFINHSRTISRLMENARNIGVNWDEGNLSIGEDPPRLLTGLPSKVDEECLQCGKPMAGDEVDQLVQDIRECLTCVE
jgi:hypothetical protein